MARKFIVGGNWKCNPASAKEANSLLKEWKKGLPNVDKSKVDVVICPPALWMSTLGPSIEGLGMEVCSQNVGKTDAGAFTGEWTAGNLLDLGIKWTLIGHSERRTKYGETDADVAEKVGKCQDIGVNVILCIGETLEEREGGKTDEVNKRQLGAVIPKVKDWDKIVIAYEPVWAIGTGKVATPDQAEETQAAIREYLKSAVSAAVADKVRIQYGGSVTPENCAELITKPNIDGFLVGGASLKPSFMDIVSKVGPSKMADMWPKFEEKMKKDDMNETAMAAFKYTYGVLVSGADVMIPESKLDPVESLMEYEKLKEKPDPRLLKKTLILKLNGGLGTGMGLDKAKSLLEVTGGLTFLDLIAKQVASMKKEFKTDLKFMLMNSFSTSKERDTREAAEERLPIHVRFQLGQLGRDYGPQDPESFCAIRRTFHDGSGRANRCDKKGGHLAKDKATGGLLLRESAQCPEEDEKEFQNVGKYKFFNTNNLWVDLVALKREFRRNDGALPLPVMKNAKTVDPRDKKSTAVLQLETAMGAAIQCFQGASALVIPRSRFAPVKTTNDLLALRSDAYTLTEDFTIVLAAERQGVPPDVKLDGMYKFMDALEKLIPNGPPSLINCKKLVVEGPMTFGKDVVIKGSVTVKNTSGTEKELAAGVYEDKTVEL